MNRTITIKKGYINTDFNTDNEREIKIGGYHKSKDEPTFLEEKAYPISGALSPELDVFSELPISVYSNNDAKDFLDEMKKCLLDYDKEQLSSVSLTKLRASEVNESSIVIEWIFNYFRFYFSFNKNEGDFYGVVINDSENQSFSNDYKKMSKQEFHDIADALVAYAAVMSGG